MPDAKSHASVPFVFDAESEQATVRLAESLATHTTRGLTVALIGTLGSGKTRWVQSFAHACGVPQGAVTSPTYVLYQEYVTERFTIYHFDAYRLETASEFLDLGSDELFAGEGVKLIEWADRVVDCLPEDRLEMELFVTGETTRRFVLQASGPTAASVLDGVRLDHPAS